MPARDERELDWLWRRRCSADGATADCPRCGRTRFHRLRRRFAYACDRCGHQVRPTSGTLFAGSSVPLATWFAATALLSRADSPQEPKRLAGELGVGYRTAWRMRRALLRALDEAGPDAELLRAIAVAWAPPTAAECPELTESPGPADPPRSQAATPRVEAICEAACRVLAARGLERTRISDIAAEAGVSSAVIHYYFESKDQLLLAALEWTDQRALESYRELQHITDDATTRLRKLVAVTAPRDDVSRNDWLLWLETWPLARRPALFPTVQRVALRYFTAVKDVIDRGCRSGEFRPVASVDEVCLRFISYADGLATRCLLGYEDFAPEKVAELLGRFAEEQLGLPCGALQPSALG